jgi:uncharacterized protein involved in exopolysaccharide biosynthesis
MFRYDPSPSVVSAAPAPRAEGFGFYSVMSALWRWKILIGLAGLIAAALMAAYAMTLPDRYQSTAQILIDPRDLRVISNDVSPTNLNSDSVTAYIESQARIISSTNTLRKIVDREGLTRDPEYVGLSSILTRLLPIGRPRDDAAGVVEKLRRNLWVRRGERTFVIDVSVIASDPDKSARLTNAFVAAFLEDQTSSRAEVSRRASASLSSRLSELRERVRQSEDKVETYKAQKNIVGASGKLVNEEQLQALNNQLAFARTRIADSRAKLEQAESVRGQAAERGAIPEAVSSQTLGLLRQQLGEAQRRATTLAAALGPQHPELLAAQQTLRDAQRSVGEEISRIRQSARVEFDRAVANEKSIATQVDQLKREALGTSRDTVELRELERELESNRAIYQSFLTRARETSEFERIDTTNARVITTATPPLERVGPQRRAMVLGAGFGGFLLGALLAIGFDARSLFRRRAEPETAMAASQPPVAPLADAGAAATSPAGQWSQEAFRGSAPPQPPPDSQAQADLLRVLRMMGQLEKAIDRYGMPR